VLEVLDRHSESKKISSQDDGRLWNINGERALARGHHDGPGQDPGTKRLKFAFNSPLRLCAGAQDRSLSSVSYGSSEEDIFAAAAAFASC
jgi:hypothetical protein